MEIYIKNLKGQLEETTLYDVLEMAFINAKFKMENGSFSGENHCWIGVVQESDKPAEVVTNITFDGKGNNITGIKVYETPIKRVVDSDHSRQVV
jgi:hypothetical protein